MCSKTQFISSSQSTSCSKLFHSFVFLNLFLRKPLIAELIPKADIIHHPYHLGRPSSSGGAGEGLMAAVQITTGGRGDNSLELAN